TPCFGRFVAKRGAYLVGPAAPSLTRREEPGPERPLAIPLPSASTSHADVSVAVPARTRLSHRRGPPRRRTPRAAARGRRRAACDLVAPEGTEILAVLPGVVVAGPYAFYHGTYAIEVDHGLYLVRYGEIRGGAEGVGAGTTVAEGQVIAYVGRMYVDSM